MFPWQRNLPEYQPEYTNVEKFTKSSNYIFDQNIYQSILNSVMSENIRLKQWKQLMFIRSEKIRLIVDRISKKIFERKCICFLLKLISWSLATTDIQVSEQLTSFDLHLTCVVSCSKQYLRMILVLFKSTAFKIKSNQFLDSLSSHKQWSVKYVYFQTNVFC